MSPMDAQRPHRAVRPDPPAAATAWTARRARAHATWCRSGSRRCSTSSAGLAPAHRSTGLGSAGWAGADAVRPRRRRLPHPLRRHRPRVGPARADDPGPRDGQARLGLCSAWSSRGDIGSIALDNRGAGRSDKPYDPYTLEHMADDADRRARRRRRSPPPMSWAHRWAARSARLIAVLHPERVRSLTLACTACRNQQWRNELLMAGPARPGGRHRGDDRRRPPAG